MINIENNNIFNISSLVNLKIGNKTIKYDINEGSNKYINIQSKGGILADEMGLGKTITTLGVIKYNSPGDTFYNNIDEDNKKIKMKGTLIIVPPHLAKQWTNEIKKYLSGLTVYTIYIKTSHLKYTYRDFQKADIIIVSTNFLKNRKYYAKLVEEYDDTINWNKENILDTYGPIFENCHFDRIVLDESHEYFSLQYQATPRSVVILQNIITNIKSDKLWIVSGTPFFNIYGLSETLNLIGLKINNVSQTVLRGRLTNKKDDKVHKYNYFLNKDIMKQVFKKYILKTNKRDIQNQVNIAGYDEEIIHVNMTQDENILYRSYANSAQLVKQQFCCHPMIVKKVQQIIKDKDSTIEDIRNELYKKHSENIINYQEILDNVDMTSPEASTIITHYTNLLNESRFITKSIKYILSLVNINIDDNIDNNDNNNDNLCGICYDEYVNPTLTKCGHIYCYDCIKQALEYKKECPQCRKRINNNGDLYVLKSSEETTDDIDNEMIKKYGTKLTKLINILNKLKEDENNKIIIFSQWDDMLRLIGKSLKESNIPNLFIKGSAGQRNTIIEKFKTGKDKKNKVCKGSNIIMLSLKHCASGTNLTEATHIIFIEPINAPKKERQSIEGQAIGRVSRIGKKDKFKIIRIITKNTIEEDIYNNYAIEDDNSN